MCKRIRNNSFIFKGKIPLKIYNREEECELTTKCLITGEAPRSNLNKNII